MARHNRAALAEGDNNAPFLLLFSWHPEAGRNVFQLRALINTRLDDVLTIKRLLHHKYADVQCAGMEDAQAQLDN